MKNVPKYSLVVDGQVFTVCTVVLWRIHQRHRNLVCLSNLGGFNALASVYFTVTAGDSIDLTENFANDEALQSNSGSQSNFSPQFSASVDPMNPLGSLFNFGISNLSITLFDFVATGGVTESDFVASDLEGRSFRLGPYFFDFTSLGQTVEISGFNLHYDIDTPLQSNFAR